MLDYFAEDFVLRFYLRYIPLSLSLAAGAGGAGVSLDGRKSTARYLTLQATATHTFGARLHVP